MYTKTKLYKIKSIQNSIQQQKYKKVYKIKSIQNQKYTKSIQNESIEKQMYTKSI